MIPVPDFFLMDSLEKEDAFYSLKNGYLKRRAGYYIYYAQKSFALSAIIDDERIKDTPNCHRSTLGKIGRAHV